MGKPKGRGQKGIGWKWRGWGLKWEEPREGRGLKEVSETGAGPRGRSQNGEKPKWEGLKVGGAKGRGVA